MHQLGDAFTTLIEQLDKRDEDLRGKSTLLFESNQRLTEHQSKLEKTVEERTLDFKLAKEQAENATEAKSQFLSTMTHELRTPMSGVIGIVDLLKETTLDFTQREYVDIISASGTQLLDIVGDILNFEKLSANKLELETIEFNFHKLCDELVMPFKLRKKGKNGLEFIVAYSDSCPENLMGDSVRIKQVINNFLSNAFKFTDAGSITLKVTSISKNNRPHVLVSVIDTGIGLNDDQQRLLFEEYQQASISTARKYGGTGLGLAISRKMVALMGGDIGLTSVPSEGSTFNFNFPLMEVIGMPSELEGNAVNLPSARSLVNLQVLVAEDNLVNQMVIKGYLKRLGIDPVLAENGEEALKRLGENDFDMILMDINMPVMDGVEATRKIREGERQENTIGMPIYGLTATSTQSARQDFMAAGMNGVLSKPIDLHQLIRALETALS
ncbi:MAG TPA: response regulator [Porticoccus sp.]|nr:response regulator [Porticoccus sp.]